MRRAVLRLALSFAALPLALCAQDSKTITATTYDSHFPRAAKGGEAWNGISVASDGIVYYVLDSPSFDVAGVMYSYDPRTKQVTRIADLNTAVGQDKIKAVAQGKSHVSFVENAGKLYFSTHLGYYAHANGVETFGAPPPGYQAYPGGHFVAYDMKTGKFEDLAISPGEGIVTFNMDTKRQRLYGITWPSGYFLRYDLKTEELKNLGTKFSKGEIGKLGDTYRSICRRIVIAPRDGSAYFTGGDGTIWKYSYATESIDAVPGVSLRKDYFGQMDPTQHGMAYNWRVAQWDPVHNVIYGINGRSGCFDPDKGSVEMLTRLSSLPAQQSGMYDKFVYGYMGFNFGPDGHTLYYLTGAPLPAGLKTAATLKSKGEATHLITYDTADGKYVDYGLILLDNGDPATAPQSIAIASDGTVYSLGFITREGFRNIDLFSFKP